jgi:hypothetical protein
VANETDEESALWLNDGSCVRARPKYSDHVWSCDFVHHGTDDVEGLQHIEQAG